MGLVQRASGWVAAAPINQKHAVRSTACFSFDRTSFVLVIIIIPEAVEISLELIQHPVQAVHISHLLFHADVVLHQFRQLLGVNGAVGSCLTQVAQGQIQIPVYPFAQEMLQAQEVLCLRPILLCRSIHPFQRRL